MKAAGLRSLPTIGPAVVTLGVFDGVHRGHRHLLGATATAAERLGATPVAIVFTPHPDEVIRPGTSVPRLVPPTVTLERLTAAGVLPVEVAFDDDLRSLTPEEFLAGLAPSIELRGITMTPESAFGRGRAGTLERVTAIGREQGFEAIPVEPASDGGDPISSSRIRRALGDGAIGEARRLLGTPPMLRGTVVHGDRRGRTLGYPTANLAFEYQPALPALGIYFGRAGSPERGVPAGHPALVSVGVRPTFGDDGRVLVEAFLLDWDGDLYDAELDLELHARLREERRFAGADELVAQMRLDEAEARRLATGPGA